MSTVKKPLEGITVLEFSQFLSGPAAGLRLSDLGAKVIKIERPGSGDLCRTLYLSDTDLGGDSTLFHAINRNKKSFAANLFARSIHSSTMEWESLCFFSIILEGTPLDPNLKILSVFKRFKAPPCNLFFLSTL